MAENETPLEKLRKIAEKLGVPYAIDKYVGPATSFAVYAMSGVTGTEFADDRAQEHIANVRFDYIMPNSKNFTAKLFEILDLLVDVGFAEPQVVIVNDEANKSHILQFTTEILV